MADKKISALVSLAGKDVAATDFFPVVDVSVTETKSLTRDELRNAVNAIQFTATKALATTAAASLPDDTIIEVAADESLSGARTRYKVAAGALVFDYGVTTKADLADASDPAKGAALVGYDGGDVQDVLDDAKPMASYTALRAYTGRATGVRVTSSGVAGLFQRDASDTTSADNGGTIIVDASGRRWKRLFDGVVSVRWFGAKGDWNGTTGTDDTTAILSALTAVKDGGTLRFPLGTYRVTSPIAATFSNGATVNILGHGAKIDGTSVTGTVPGDTTLLTFGGARLTGVALGTSAAKYATSITSATAISAAINDIALISSTDLWNPTRAYYYKGEFIEMLGISGTTISHAELFDSYTNSTTTVYPLSMPTINVEGFEIVMNANQTGLAVSYSRNPTIRKIKIHGARYTGISLQYCFGGSVEDSDVYDAWYSGTGTSYGIAVATCQAVVIKGNNVTEARHCISGGGWEPCRNVIYAHNVCTGHPSEPGASAIDQHGNMEFCQILDNIANGGISVSGINAVVKNNIVSEYRSASGQAILVYQEISSEFYDISGNSVTTNGIVYGISYTPTAASINTDRILFHDNNINSGGRAINMQPRNASITGHTIGKLSVKNNIATATGASQVCFYHGVNGAASFTTTLFDSANNIYKAGAYDAFAVQGVVANAFSTNDKFYANRLNGYMAYFGGIDVTCVNPYFEGNVGGAGNARSVYYKNTGTSRCINPVFKNVTYKAELEVGGPSLYIEQGWYAATPTILNASGARLVNFYGALGRAIGYGTTAPTTGTWGVGDRVYSQSPTVGQPKSWVCTVSGTPGTWVSEGNL